MTPGARGWIVLALLAVAVGTLIGSKIGADATNAHWERWTYAHVAFETKGNRQ